MSIIFHIFFSMLFSLIHFSISVWNFQWLDVSMRRLCHSFLNKTYSFSWLLRSVCKLNTCNVRLSQLTAYVWVFLYLPLSSWIPSFPGLTLGGNYEPKWRNQRKCHSLRMYYLENHRQHRKICYSSILIIHFLRVKPSFHLHHEVCINFLLTNCNNEFAIIIQLTLLFFFF